MSDDLLLYYERELTYLRKLGAEFAQQYPKVASRLQLEASKCEDPHVERLLEGVAFLTARVHRRLDDDFPEISYALLEMLHPQLVRPLPSMCIVELELDPAQGRLPEGFFVPRGSVLNSRPVQGVPCPFRTTFDTTLWPLNITSAEWTTPDRAGTGARGRDATAAIRLRLRAFDGVRLSTVTIDKLRLHLAADAGVADTLYELLTNSCLQVVVRNPQRPMAPPVLLDANAIVPVGFSPNETLLPYDQRAFAGYSFLQELFAFPEKFRFIDVVGLSAAFRTLDATDEVELSFLIGSFERTERRQALELGLSARTFRTGCTPAINLFEQTGEPMVMSERSYEYPVIPDVRRRVEVETWSVNEVSLIEQDATDVRIVRPLYAHGHQVETGNDDIFWQASRRVSLWRTDHGTDVFLSFTDRSGTMRVPDVDVLSVRLTCFNGDLPSRLPFGADERGDFELVGGGPLRRIMTVVNPTRTTQPVLGSSLLWRMISSLSLNHLSLVDATPQPLQELLRLHNVTNALSAERQIDGLVGVVSEPAFSRVAVEHGIAFVRGRKITLEFDESAFPGGGMFLFASVLERFLALYASMNSFTQVSVRSRQRRLPVVEWPARAGWRTIL